MPPIGPGLLVLAPLAAAAGIDLYLTLLLLGASPTIGLWDQPLPGALADLDSPGVMIVVGAMYVVEFAAERYPTASLVWNGFHAVIRPVSGALLALLVLDGQPLSTVALGAVVAAGLASFTHALRSGGAVLRWLDTGASPDPTLVSLLEDTIVLGIVALALDLPQWALGVTVLLLVAAVPRGLGEARAFVFALNLVISRVFQSLGRSRWLGPDELPEWVTAVLDDDDVLAPGGALRGSPVGAYRLPGVPRFVTGWVLVRGGSPVLVFRRRAQAGSVPLSAAGDDPVLERAFFRRVAVDGGRERTGALFFGRNGPSEASLRAEFHASPG